MKIQDIPVNPRLRKMFDCTPNEKRKESELKRWWNVPFIKTYSIEDFGEPTEEIRKKWFKQFPEGLRYDVRCLDGGCWDRPTHYGTFKTIKEAIECAKKV